MNGKKAKALRRVAKNFFANEELTYEEQQHKQKLISDVMGNRLYITPVTRKLVNCQREVYQELKKHS